MKGGGIAHLVQPPIDMAGVGEVGGLRVPHGLPWPGKHAPVFQPGDLKLVRILADVPDDQRVPDLFPPGRVERRIGHPHIMCEPEMDSCVAEYDSPWKKSLENYFEPFMLFFLSTCS